jgi:glucose/arabinose dehydrogenase
MRSLLIAATASLALAAPAAAAGPRAANGQPVMTVASHVATPTSFAFDTATGTAFVGAFGDERTGKGGGVLAIAPGRPAALVPGIPSGVAGLVDQQGTLYVSARSRILAYRDWNGSAFASSTTIFDARATVGEVNGIALGPDGRLYGGGGLLVDVDRKGRAKRSPVPHPYSVFSIKTDGTDFRIVARGLRQPWQMTFVAGNPNPFVSVLSQDAGKVPYDAIVLARPGANFGFPKCFAGVGMDCRKRYAKPLILLPRHASPMGIQAVGTMLYVALFGGHGNRGPEVVMTPAEQGGKLTTFLVDFPAPVVALGISGGYLYAGDLSGAIYRVAL